MKKNLRSGLGGSNGGAAKQGLRALGGSRSRSNPLPAPGARVPATVKRAERYGIANQIAHEQAGRRQRTEALFGMARGNEARRAAAARTGPTRGAILRQKERGTEAGTVGGSRRGPLIQAFMGKGRGRYA